MESGLELHHIVRTKAPKLIVTPMPPLTEGQRARLFRVIESYQTGVARQDFVPSPGFHCAGCEFFGECRDWH
jgi:putative RecB family exonuclease